MFRTFKYIPKLYTPSVSVSDSFSSKRKFSLLGIIYNVGEISNLRSTPRMNQISRYISSEKIGEVSTHVLEEPWKKFGELERIDIPDETTPDRIFEGVSYKFLPIINVRVSKNNVIMNLTDYKGNVKVIRSCGVEGFKNVQKGTAAAAQATALTFSAILLEKGYTCVRLRIKGLGPGRTSNLNISVQLVLHKTENSMGKEYGNAMRWSFRQCAGAIDDHPPFNIHCGWFEVDITPTGRSYKAKRMKCFSVGKNSVLNL